MSAGVNTGARMVCRMVGEWCEEWWANGDRMVREWSAYMSKESSLISEIVTHF